MVSYASFLKYEEVGDIDVFDEDERGYGVFDEYGMELDIWNADIKQESFTERLYIVLENAFAVNISFFPMPGFKDDEVIKKVSYIRYSKNYEWISVYLYNAEELDWKRFADNAKCLKYLTVAGYREEIPEDIYRLSKIKYLELWECSISKTFEQVVQMEQIEILDINHSEVFVLPQNINKLQRLKKLSCMYTLITELPETIKDLKRLQYLGLNGTGIIEVPKCISELTELRSLYLGKTQIKILPDEMKKLINLEYLALWETEITKLPDWISGFSRLRGLYLGGTKGICYLPDEIGQLSQLEKVFLNNTNIQELPESFGKLKNLKEILLYNTPLRKFPELSEMPDLKLVNLSEMTLERIPRQFTNGNMINVMNDDLIGEGLVLYNTKLLCQPISLFFHEKEFIDAYYEEEKIHLNETKVVFLGDGEAGKSHIIERMKHDGKLIDKSQDGATPGIAISEKKYTIDKEEVKLQIWDFGGQEIMHSMHRFFLTDRTLYVIVINSRDNTQDERAKYWLNNVKSFADGCPVILVLNKIDQNPSASLNERLLQKDFPQIVKTIKMSALNDKDEEFGKLKDTIINTVKGFDSYAMEFPVTWNNIKNTLMQMKENYIIDEQYRKICINNKVEDRSIQNWLLDWFHDLGVSFNYYKKDVLLSGYMVLKPQWITNAIYIVLFNGVDKAENGLMPVLEIVELLKNPPKAVEKIEYSISEIPYILGVMRRFEISYEIDKDYEFIPMMCIKNQHEDAESYVEDCDLEYYMEYEYLPNNVLHKLMIKMKSDLIQEKIWLTGMILEAKMGNISALVRLHDKRIEIYIKAIDKEVYQPKEYLTEIRKHLLLINEELNLKANDMIVYKEDGQVEAISYDMLLIYLSSGVSEYFSTVFRKQISIKKILGVVENSKTIDTIFKLCNDHDKVTNRMIQGIIHRMNAIKQLEQDIISDCISIQGDTLQIQQGKENDRNTYLRNLLKAQKYIVQDQTLNGTSSEGKAAGELDLLVSDNQYQPIAIIEALNLTCIEAEYIKKHVNKLFSYDTWGLEKNYILVYAKTSQFTNFCKRYVEFIEQDTFCEELTSASQRDSGYNNIFLLDSWFLVDEKAILVTHIVVKI